MMLAVCTLLAAPAFAAPGEPDAYAPIVHTAPTADPVSPWARAATLAVAAALIAGFAAAYRRTPPLARALLLIGGASLVTRAFVPFVPMHTQTDDLRLVATARGVEGFTVNGFNSDAGTILPVVRLAMGLAGDNLEAAHLPSFLAGLLLAPLALLLGARWFRSVRLGAWTAVPLLLGPAAWAFTGAISAYMIAAALFAASLLAGVEAGRQRGPARAVLLLVSGAILLVTSLLKPEFLLLIPIHGVLLVVSWRASGEQRGWPVALAPAAAVLAVVMLAFYPFLDTFFDRTQGRLRRAEGLWLQRILEYAFLGFLVLNPPFLPWKLVFIRSLFRPADLPLRALQATTLALASLYVLSGGSTGFNQWRHALVFLVPFHLAIAPELDRLAASRRSVAFRALALALVLGDLIGYAVYADQVGIRMNPAGPFRAAGLDDRALVLYVPHGQDQDPSSLFAAAGVPNSLPLDALWPPSCPEGADQRLIEVRTSARNLTNRLGDWAEDPACEVGTHFRDVRTLDQDFDWLRACLPAMDRGTLDTMVDATARIRGAVDPALCARELEATTAMLRPFDRVFLFVDRAIVDEELDRLGREYVRREALDLAANRLELESPLQATRPNLIEVRRVTAAGKPDLWVRR